jgi:transposase
MLSFLGKLKVYLSIDAADLRKSFNGLYGLAEGVLKEDPRRGGLFVFTNQRRNRIKILYWDGTGLWVMTKRLEKGTFS